MHTDERKTTRKIYEQPELKVMAFELGVYGNYGDPDGPGPKQEYFLGLGISAE
jgi:hypothetical protein